MSTMPCVDHIHPRPCPARAHPDTKLPRSASATLYIPVTRRLYLDALGRALTHGVAGEETLKDTEGGGVGASSIPAGMADYAREQVLRRKLEALVKAELRGVDARWVEQAFSPLGPRKHIAAVRQRIAEAERRGVSPLELGAAMRGKRTYLLTPEAIAEELGKLPMRKVREPAANDTDAEESAYAEVMARAGRGR